MKKLISLLHILVLFGAQTFAQKQVAITIDDLPIAYPRISLTDAIAVNKKLVETLHSNNVPVTGFVNEVAVDVFGQETQRLEILRLWLANDFDLGNHTYSHISYQETNYRNFITDIERGENHTKKILAQRHKQLEFFRAPMNETGATIQQKAELEGYLSKRHYRMTPFTIEVQDNVFNLLYLAAKVKNDSIARVRVVRDYINFFSKRLGYAEQLSAEISKTEFPQVFLCHDNQINADNMDKLLDVFRNHGYQFISLQHALDHPTYQRKDPYIGTGGPSWLQRWNTKNRAETLATEPALLLPARIAGVFKDILYLFAALFD